MSDSARTDLQLASHADWLKVFDPREGTVRVKLPAVAELGATVRIDLTVGDGGPVVVLRGEVVGVQEAGDESGITAVVALGPTEREKINYLNGFVRGGMLNLRERRRVPVRLKITYGGVGGPVETTCRDISDDGIFVISDEPLPEQTKLHMFVHLPGQTAPMSVAGVVSHTVVADDGDVPGMGVTFVLDPSEQGRLSVSLDELEVALGNGTLSPDLVG